MRDPTTGRIVRGARRNLAALDQLEICGAAIEMFAHDMSFADVAAPESRGGVSDRCGREARSVRSCVLQQASLAERIGVGLTFSGHRE
jgi:hypothetical protein